MEPCSQLHTTLFLVPSPVYHPSSKLHSAFIMAAFSCSLLSNDVVRRGAVCECTGLTIILIRHNPLHQTDHGAFAADRFQSPVHGAFIQRALESAGSSTFCPRTRGVANMASVGVFTDVRSFVAGGDTKKLLVPKLLLLLLLLLLLSSTLVASSPVT